MNTPSTVSTNFCPEICQNSSRPTDQAASHSQYGAARTVAIGLGLILVIRPLVGWLSLLRTGMTSGDRIIVGFFGVRGIVSLYYIGYATGHMEFVNEDTLWALVAYTIFASALLHGATTFLVDRYASPLGRREL